MPITSADSEIKEKARSPTSARSALRDSAQATTPNISQKPPKPVMMIGINQSRSNVLSRKSRGLSGR